MYVKQLLIHQFKSKSHSQNISHQYSTRLKVRNKLITPRAQKTIATKYFLYLAPRIYNVIPDILKNTTYTRFVNNITKWIKDTKYEKLDIFVNTGFFPETQ